MQDILKKNNRLLVQRFLLLLVFYSITRLLFYFFNKAFFQPALLPEIAKSFFYGIRFDYAVLFYTNIPFVFIMFIPARFHKSKSFQKIYKYCFIIVNSLIILPNFIDLAYFVFNNKRSSIDLLRLFSVSKDVYSILPEILKTYWYVALIWLVFVYLFWRLYPDAESNTNKSLATKFQFSNRIQKIINISFIPLFLFVSIGLARGFELKPLRIISSNNYVEPKYAPLVLNTTFTIINTIGHTTFEPYNFFSSDELNKHFSPIKKYSKEQKLCFDCENDSLCFEQKKLENANVVILILESFGAEYIGYLNPYHKGYTPFLDSLFEKSIVFTNAFANGKRSIDALPAIFASLPDITSEPLIGSQFSNNTYFSLPAMLEKQGYYTSFFHGGANGTMGFDIFCKSSGISNYYGKNEYEGPGDDGNWGIFDEEFLSFMADKITTFPEPFFSSVFTLSSHHPYLIPKKHKDKFEEGTLPIHKSISYADYSLRKFFEKIKNFDWYKNTIFIITADHTSQSTHPYFQTSTGNYRIPIAFFIPSIPNLKGKIPNICQQSDIFPSTMQILGIEQKFISFGNSVFDKHENHFGLTRYNNSFQLLNNDFMILNDGTDKSSKVLYRYKTDSMLQTNVIKNYPEVYDSLSYKLKGILQDYTYRLKMNQLKELK